MVDLPTPRVVKFTKLVLPRPGLRHPEIRGMVLQSPMESCGRVVAGEAASWLGYRRGVLLDVGRRC